MENAAMETAAMEKPGGVVVVIEDDDHISDLVALYLRRDGFRVLQAADGAAGLEAVARQQTRLAVVDIGLPGQIDGFEVCRRLRRDGNLPVVMLTARDDEMDRILGLELGADDYVTKPFSPRELVARVHAILRRTTPATAPATSAVMAVGGVEVDRGRREARLASGPVALTTREFDLLAFLAANQGLALSRQQLLDGVWGQDWFGDALPLTTVWGVGYRLG